MSQRVLVGKENDYWSGNKTSHDISGSTSAGAAYHSVKTPSTNNFMAPRKKLKFIKKNEQKE